ncbi:hypothetical protein J6590_044899 [Homalodisca vitripennis]|nr:hypothetical protein J6590_044899 [Homalodisca vitripennis]
MNRGYHMTRHREGISSRHSDVVIDAWVGAQAVVMPQHSALCVVRDSGSDSAAQHAWHIPRHGFT